MRAFHYFREEGLDIVGSNACEELKGLNGDELGNQAKCEILGFYKGENPTWKLFFFSNPSSLPITGQILPGVIERRITTDLVRDIDQLDREKGLIVAKKRILHQPGAGASTVTMQALWNKVISIYLIIKATVSMDRPWSSLAEGD